jgi:hypothetical protein
MTANIRSSAFENRLFDDKYTYTVNNFDYRMS